MMRSGLLCAAVAAACCATVLSTSTPLSGQAAPISPNPQDPPAAVFRTASELVVLHVNVFDGRSDAVENLPQSAFTVLEDERPQAITFFNSADVPVAVGLVIDNSGSMITQRAMVVAGATAFADSTHREDQLFTIVFNEHVRWGLPDGVAFTNTRPQLLSGLARYPAGGKTAVFDAVIAGLEHLKNAPHQKRVLIVLSDGEDNASRHTREEMLSAAAASDALIYTIARRDFTGGSSGDPRLMRRLAEISGGVVYYPRTESDVIKNFGEIAANIRRGYSIGYTPSTPHDGRYHQLKVMVRTPGRTLSARARHGYASAGPDAAQ